jgi:hypothetical protein
MHSLSRRLEPRRYWTQEPLAIHGDSLAAAGPAVDTLVKGRLLVIGRDDATRKETLEVAREALMRN